MLIAGHHDGVAGDGSLRVEAQALANAPRVLEPRLTRAGASWEVSFTAEFVNACFAGQGMALRYLDAAAAGARLLLAEQRSPLEGCPEIYRPVRRPQRFVVPAAATVRALVWLDIVDGQQPYRMPVAEAGTRTLADEASRAQAVDAVLPTVDTARLTGNPSLSARFDVPLPAACPETALRLMLLDGRGAVAGREVQPATVWLLLLADNDASCRGFDGLPARPLQARLPELPPGREVRLVNPVRHGRSAEGEMFEEMLPPAPP